MNEKRSVAGEFINAMEKGLAHGRRVGRTGWDSHWQESSFADVRLGLLDKLDEEVGELIEAIEDNENGDVVLLEAADVANIAMMLADITL